MIISPFLHDVVGELPVPDTKPMQVHKVHARPLLFVQDVNKLNIA